MSDLFSYAETYPARPGHKAKAGPSVAAADAMQTHVALLQAKVLAAFRAAPDGLTADEAAARIPASILAVRPRCSELVKSGDLIDTKERRENSASGRTATVWRAA